MPSYKNFQSDNAKHTSNRSNHNPAVNSNVMSAGEKQVSMFLRNIEKHKKFVSWARWNPDLFLDMIRPVHKDGTIGGLSLHLDQRVFLRCALRFWSMYGVFPRGWGKCVSFDTLIYTTEGIKEIGELFDYKEQENEEWIPNDNITILNRYGDREKISSLYNGGYKPTKKIKTEYGYDIEGTNNHPVLAMTESGSVEWKRLSELSVGDYLVINRNNNIWGNDDCIDMNLNMEAWLKSRPPAHNKKLAIRKLPNILNEDLALVLGYLIGDGNVTTDSVMTLTNADKDIVDNFKRIMFKQFGVIPTDVPSSKYAYSVYGKYLRKYFEFIGVGRHTAHNKEIPKSILKSSKKNVAAFLRGLFDTDGYVGKCTVSVCTVSKKMAKQIQMCLLNFGIVSRLKYREDNKGFYHYSIYMCGENIDKFYKYIGFSCRRKQDLLYKHTLKTRNTNKDIIPFQNNLIQSIYPNLKELNVGVHQNIGHVVDGENNLTYKKLDYILSLNGLHTLGYYNHFVELKERNYFYTKITSIDDSENYVCDLSVPETHSFVSNGLVSHNTFNEVLAYNVVAVLYPGITLSITAQTKENAAKILKDKQNEIWKFYPLLKNETFDYHFRQNEADVKFLNDSVIDILANSQTSKGQRRRRINVEEAALLDKVTFEDALEPIVEVPRMTAGKLGIVDPQELNQSIHFFTTSGFRNSDEYHRMLEMIKAMVNLEGKMVLGSNWMLGCWYNRGSTKNQILQKKKTMSPTAFAMNYEEKWTGTVDSALVNINKVLKLRTIPNPHNKAEKGGEYILAVDVARSEKTSNNRSSVAVLQLKRKGNGNISTINLVNLIDISNTLSFTNQAIEIKRLRNTYDAQKVIVDSNGLGAGLIDTLLLEQFDPLTGKSLGCWNTSNTDAKPEISGSPAYIFDLKPQSASSDVLVAFIDSVEAEQLRILIKKINADYDINDQDNFESNILPFIQTDYLVDEIANLKLKTLPSGKLSLDKAIKRIGKDRFSALSYGVWYARTFMEREYDEDAYDDLDLYFF